MPTGHGTSGSAAFRAFGGGHRAAVKDRGAVQCSKIEHRRIGGPGAQTSRKPVTTLRGDGGDTNSQGKTSPDIRPGQP
jgi:hypothetical protein